MFPSMRDVLSGFTRRNQFAVVTKTVSDFEAVESKAAVAWFSGSFQPLPSQRLTLKPEGQRTWKWWTLWTTQKLKLDDVVKDRCNKEYRVLSVSDWFEAGYYQYDLAEQPIGL